MPRKLTEKGIVVSSICSLSLLSVSSYVCLSLYISPSYTFSLSFACTYFSRSLSVESFGSLARAVDRENAEYDARCSTTGAINSNQDYDNESMKSQEDWRTEGGYSHFSLHSSLQQRSSTLLRLPKIHQNRVLLIPNILNFSSSQHTLCGTYLKFLKFTHYLLRFRYYSKTLLKLYIYCRFS